MQCPDGMCPVRAVIERYGGADPSTRVIRGGGVRPCCDVVLDNVRFDVTMDALKNAHGLDYTDEPITVIVTRYMQPTCRVTARMLSRAVEMYDVDLEPHMSITALGRNINKLAEASGNKPPTFDPAPELTDSQDLKARYENAGKYALWMEEQHLRACQWLASIQK